MGSSGAGNEIWRSADVFFEQTNQMPSTVANAFGKLICVGLVEKPPEEMKLGIQPCKLVINSRVLHGLNCHLVSLTTPASLVRRLVNADTSIMQSVLGSLNNLCGFSRVNQAYLAIL